MPFFFQRMFLLRTAAKVIPVLLVSGAIFLSCPLYSFPIDRDGLRIDIKYEKPDLPGYASFRILVQNLTDQPKTLNGRLELYQVVNGLEQSTGTCQVYVQVLPAQYIEKSSSCPAQEFRLWKFLIDGVYNFILE